jgi:ubiquinone/menaquinone biosynthesis C-methylase UbiE
MHNQPQKQYFLQAEADNWYERNLGKINQYDPSTDKIISLLKQYNASFSKVLEIGCSEGYRLEGIRQNFSAEVAGVEPSVKALEAGKKKYPAVDLHHGTADDLAIFRDASFDIVIMGFIFYVIDRSLLIKCMSEADRVLKSGGILMILDFFSEKPVRRKYHHIGEFDAYSFKQPYDEMFSATQLYHLLHRSTYDHNTMEANIGVDYQDLISLSVLKKDIEAAYR